MVSIRKKNKSVNNLQKIKTVSESSRTTATTSTTNPECSDYRIVRITRFQIKYYILVKLLYGVDWIDMAQDRDQ
jgi:hypothetical protein